MKVYLSTTSSDIPKARSLMQAVRDSGHAVTVDWTEGFENEPEMRVAELQHRADMDIVGVLAADVVVIYMQPKMKTHMTGAAIEMGAAFGVNLPVIVVEQEATFDHFFKHHPLVTKVGTWAEAFTLIDRWGRGEAR